MDLENKRQVTSIEIKEYVDSNNSLDNQEIDLNNGQNIKELLIKINSAVNELKNNLPINMISEDLKKNSGYMNYKTSLRFILLGDTTVGKTSFYKRYSLKKFDNNTIGYYREIKYVKVKNDIYQITLWDTAGQERFRVIPKRYYSNADGIFLLFDVTNEETFNNISHWMEDLKESGKDSKYLLYLIGNKIDKPDRVIQKDTAESLAKSLGIKYFEISCKINMNIPEVISRMIFECSMGYYNKIISVSPIKQIILPPPIEVNTEINSKVNELYSKTLVMQTLINKSKRSFRIKNICI